MRVAIRWREVWDRRLRGSASVLLVVLSACLATRALAESCPSGISPETTKRLFDRVKNVTVGEGYHFDGLGTQEAGRGLVVL